MRKIAITRRKGECAPMRGLLGCVLAVCALRTLTAWEATLTPGGAGPFSEVAPFEGEFRFGWSEIEAARVKAVVSNEGNKVVLKAHGGTQGLARTLYQLDVVFSGEAEQASLQTISSELVERYASRTVTERVVGENGMLKNYRDTQPAGKKPPRWKDVKVSPIRDLWAAMLFIRSQSLTVGERVRVLVFPGGAPYLIEIMPLGLEQLEVMGAPREALKLDVKVQRVNTKKGNALEPHGKFRSGKIWIGVDEARMPLRAEVDIFIGYVFAEIVGIEVKERAAR